MRDFFRKPRLMGIPSHTTTPMSPAIHPCRRSSARRLSEEKRKKRLPKRAAEIASMAPNTGSARAMT